MTNDAPSVSDAIDKLVDQSVNDVRADEDAAAQAVQQQWDEAQGIYGDLGVAALDRSTSAAHQLGDNPSVHQELRCGTGARRSVCRWPRRRPGSPEDFDDGRPFWGWPRPANGQVPEAPVVRL